MGFGSSCDDTAEKDGIKVLLPEFAGNPKGLFEAVEEELRLRSYSPKTAKVYLGQLRAFVRFFKPRHPRELSDEDIRRYLLYLTDNELLPRCLLRGKLFRTRHRI